MADTGFATHKVHFHRENQSAFILTYPLQPESRLDNASPVESILINAQRIHDAVAWQLDHHVEELRQSLQTTMLHRNFDLVMRSAWGIGEDDNIVAMTEDQFTNPTRVD